jgi:epoxyqueuosine reductase
MTLEAGLESELRNRGADIVSYIDLTQLSHEQNKGYPNALLIGIKLSPEYIKRISSSKIIDADEFHATEVKTDQLADYITDYISSKGYSAFSQSEDSIFSTGDYNESTLTTPLPHKTIAGLAGLGWIGKHNLLVSPEFGSAISMCSVLTDAPLKTVLCTPASSQCGDCSTCIDICPVSAIKGPEWKKGIHRDELVDVYLCKSCLLCLALCPWTQEYVNKAYK